jgi:hypothetical protein
MSNPTRDLPRVINTSMTTVITAFALMNAALYVCLSMKTLRENSAVAVVMITPCRFFLAIESNIV